MWSCFIFELSFGKDNLVSLSKNRIVDALVTYDLGYNIKKMGADIFKYTKCTW